MRPHPKQAVLIPSDADFAALKLAQVVISFWRLDKLDMAYELDYRWADHVEALGYICETAEKTHHAYLDDPEVFWDRERILAYSISETFQTWFTRRDWLQLGWIKESRVRIPRLLQIITDPTNVPKEASEWTFPEEYPVLRRGLNVATQCGPARERIRLLLDLFNDTQTAMQFYLDATEIFERLGREQIPKPVRAAIGTLMVVWNIQGLDPRASDWGRRQHYIDGPRRAIGFYTIDVDGFYLNKEEEAQSYWQWLQPIALVDAPAYLDPSDMPANPKVVFDGWDKDTLTVNSEAAAEAITSASARFRDCDGASFCALGRLECC
jgi:hypothetical protein